LSLSGVEKYVPAVLGGEKVEKREMVISQPILISPLPLPPVSCWREILKLLDGQIYLLSFRRSFDRRSVF